MVIHSWQEFAALYFAASVIVYVLLSGSSYWLLWVRGKRSLARHKIQRERPGMRQIRAEVRWSAVTMVIFSAVATLLYVAWDHGLAPLVYTDVAEHGWGYFFLSILLMVLLHDAWFYWSHRFMHQPWFFRRFHNRHHRSRTPTPWSTHTFHPLEALIEVAILPLVVFIIPAHPVAIAMFVLVSKVYNNIGHMGHELLPGAFSRRWLLEWSNTATHHDMHHSRGTGNYGLYFNFWDRVMGTNLADYVAEFERVTASEPVRGRGEVLGATET